ncbi:DnaT-like ssDNA-binding domain-containing protein [Pantoea sp. S18]|uniref:DnaT-like ssDNA-binding domain-containing protein n=1 Tax=Pantoea sp. S18 TaxID=3019892 RepID=UPI002B2127F4|nr:DnaT-like ssDNA-binding domain-containing protein [Pantoea sp. S18]MEA5101459.1 DnaT-like ssDNA-binding domain-containing protein [Pantoea sp. S18]
MFAKQMKSPEVLSSHPKVHLMAQHLLIPPRSVGEGSHRAKQEGSIRDKRDIIVTGLLKFWSVAKHHARKGVIPDADLSYIDAVVNHPGFGQAMQKVGWVKYDKRRNCLALPEMKGEQQKIEGKKSQAALRQQRYRMRLKVRNWIVEGRRAAAELANSSRFKNQTVVIKHDEVYDEEGRLLKLGSITVDGKTTHVGYCYPQHKTTDKHGRRSWASDISISDSCDKPGVTQSVTSSVTPDDSGVTQSVTSSVTPAESGVSQSVTGSISPGDSGVTQSVTSSVTPDDSGVTQSVTGSISPGDSGVTQSVTGSVTPDDSGVTQSVTGNVTPGDSGVTQSVTDSITPGDSGVTRNVPGGLTRVIPSRARTRFSFLRSKTLKSKSKTTHIAREKISWPVDNFDPNSKIALTPDWLTDFPAPWVSKSSPHKTRPSGCAFDAMRNVTQSVTILRTGNSATCVTRKRAACGSTGGGNAQSTEQAKFRLDPHWTTSSQFLKHARHIGIDLDSDASNYELSEFVNYWMEEGAEHTQKQWETKLARFIGKGRKRAAKRASGHQDFTIPTSMDYAIPHGFHGG